MFLPAKCYADYDRFAHISDAYKQLSNVEVEFAS